MLLDAFCYILLAASNPWYADYANYLRSNHLLEDIEYQGNFFYDYKLFFWDELYLFTICKDNIIKHVTDEEIEIIISHCNTKHISRHFSIYTCYIQDTNGWLLLAHAILICLYLCKVS